MIGKQESPGANEAKSIYKVLFFLTSVIFDILKMIGLNKKIIILKKSAISGNNKYLESIWTLTIEIKIVAGKAILRIYTFKPFLKSGLLNLNFNRNPKKIKIKKTEISEVIEDIKLGHGFVKRTYKSFHILPCSDRNTTPLFIPKIHGFYRNSFIIHFS